MAQVRFASDPHFGHTNMAIRRGFKDVYEHDEHIIAQLNSVVNKRDVTYLLGDITMEKANYTILDRLNGIKKVLLGNHDQPQHVTELLKHVNSVAGIYKYKHKKVGSIWLTHCPVHSKELIHRVRYNIHGHVHENSINDHRYINVCMENIDYIPKRLDELIKF